MSDPRAPIFGFLRPHLKGDGWNDKALREGMDMHLDLLGVPKVAAPQHDLPRRVSRAGIDLIHSFESCKLRSYPDPGSRDGHPWTIGWGSTGPDIGPGLTWTQQQCDERFSRDLVKFEKGVEAALDGAPTTQPQFDALVSFAYNVGLGALRGSTLLRRHKAGDFTGAANEFRKWRFNDGREMRGLARRRDAEDALYRRAP